MCQKKTSNVAVRAVLIFWKVLINIIIILLLTQMHLVRITNIIKFSTTMSMEQALPIQNGGILTLPKDTAQAYANRRFIDGETMK